MAGTSELFHVGEAPPIKMILQGQESRPRELPKLPPHELIFARRLTPRTEEVLESQNRNPHNDLSCFGGKVRHVCPTSAPVPMCTRRCARSSSTAADSHRPGPGRAQRVGHPLQPRTGTSGDRQWAPTRRFELFKRSPAEVLGPAPAPTPSAASRLAAAVAWLLPATSPRRVRPPSGRQLGRRVRPR